MHLKGTILTEAGYTPGMTVPWHYHENAYFFLHLKGHLEEMNKKKSITCTPSTLLFHYWQDPHCNTHISEDARFFHIEIENGWFQKFSVKPALLEGSFALTNPLQKAIFKKIHQEIRLNDEASQLSVDGLLAQAFSLMLRQPGYERSSTPIWVKKVQQVLLHGHAADYSLQLLSNETGLHPVYLSKEFPRYFGVSFGQYIRQMKQEKATQLLLDKKRSITDIAYECGYADQSHFIRAFKQAHGITPLKYRNARLNL